MWSDVAGIQARWGHARAAEVRIYSVQGGWGVWMREVTGPTQTDQGQIMRDVLSHAIDPRL